MEFITKFGSSLSDLILSRASSSHDNNGIIKVVAIGTAGIVIAVQVFTKSDPLGNTFRFWRQLSNQEKRLSSSESVAKGVDYYSSLHREKSVDERNKNYAALVNHYYDLATVFYEWGWCSSFHFSFQFPHENFYEATRRHEYQIASHLVSCLYDKKKSGEQAITMNGDDSGEHHQIPPNKKKVLDVGCGIGGPARNISKFLHTSVTGITLNEYQVQRGNELHSRDKNADCVSVQGNFMQMPFADNEFDAAYAIEATCHAPNRADCYKEVLRCIKPGSVFAVYEWCTTDKFDPTNPEHLRLKKDIEEGNGLPDLLDCDGCCKAMEEAGFELLTAYDCATIKNVQSWQTPLLPSWNPLSQRFQFNWLGGHLTNIAIFTLELLWLAPKGTVKTQKILQAGGFALRDAGEAGIFTTMYLMVGRKP